MSKDPILKRFAVISRWKDNPNDFSVLEYFKTKEECVKYISEQTESKFRKLEIGMFQ